MSIPSITDKNDSTKFVYIQAIAFAIGVFLLFLLVYLIGFQSIFHTISKIGWGFLVIVSLNGIRHFIRAYCLYLAVPKESRNFKYRSILAVRLSGEAVSFVTFAGPFLGDATKAALMRKFIPLSKSGAAVIIDNLLYYVSVMMIMIGGAIAMVLMYANSDRMNYALGTIFIFGLLGMLGVVGAIYLRIKPLSYIVGVLNRREIGPKSIRAKSAWVDELETNVHDTFENRKGTFFAMFCLIWLSHFLSFFEVYAALSFLGYSPSFFSSFIIEALTKVINFSFSFVPGTVGVYEGGNAIILRALGYTPAVGVALAFVRRGAGFVWLVVGAIILAWAGAAKTSEKLVKKDVISG